MIKDLGPSLARFDSIDATTDGSRPRWFPGTYSPVTLEFPIFFFLVFVFILLRCGLRKLKCLSSLCGQSTHTQKPDTHPSPSNSSPAPCETLDMEAEMERLNRKIHNPREEPEENPYSTSNKHLKEVLEHVHKSAINQAHAAYHSDAIHQR